MRRPKFCTNQQQSSSSGSAGVLSVPGILPQSHRPTICLCALGLAQSAWETPGPTGTHQAGDGSAVWSAYPGSEKLGRPSSLEPPGCTGRHWDEACPEHSAHGYSRKKQTWPWDSSFPAGIKGANKKLLWVCSAAPPSSAHFCHFSAEVANAQCDEQEQLPNQTEN